MSLLLIFIPAIMLASGLYPMLAVPQSISRDAIDVSQHDLGVASDSNRKPDVENRDPRLNPGPRYRPGSRRASATVQA